MGIILKYFQVIHYKQITEMPLRVDNADPPVDCVI